ncbi:MAG: nuclear transport factor 2 family protein [Chromatiales bacterium]|nr:nuclear transport factor 2 family protein [Chromatiales bacterium]
MSSSFETPQDTEDAFYDAFEAGDLGAMQAAWENSEDIACIHPVSPVLRGPAAVMDAWKQIFEAGAGMSIEVHHHHWIEQGELAIHIVEERISQSADPRRPPVSVLASNVYRLGTQGWLMVLHHASPPPPPPQPPMPEPPINLQ